MLLLYKGHGYYRGVNVMMGSFENILRWELFHGSMLVVAFSLDEDEYRAFSLDQH